MKNLFLIIITFLSTFCYTSEEVPYVIAKNYFIKNTYPEKNLHMLKITSSSQFDEIFGMATLMGSESKPTSIDFSHQFVIALIDNANNETESINIESLKEENASLKLIYSITKRNEKSSAQFRFSKILIIDKKFDKEVYANIVQKDGIQVVGADMNDKGCKPSTGYSWSILKNDCIQAFATDYILEGKEINDYGNAALIFNTDKTKAEIIGSKFSKNLILTKNSKKNIWSNKSITLILTKKKQYILKDFNKEIAKGHLRSE